MVRKSIFLLSTALLLAGAARAQKCATDEVHREAKARNPQIAVYEQQLERDIERYMADYYRNAAAARGTNADWNYVSGYDSMQSNAAPVIPVVVHVVHDYGAEYVADTQIYSLIRKINDVFNARNTAQLNQVITPFKEYIGNMHFTFRLATIDPDGNPTTGITRHYKYTTRGGDEAAKVNLWPPTKYMNIWTESYVGRGAKDGITLAYATYPSGGAANPYSDGLISRADATGSGGALDNTLEHEIGHYFNLPHTWGEGEILTGCGDDGVDDTPPTRGHYSTCELFDTACAQGYQKTYSRNGNSYTVNFPDTANTQNIMDYSNCTVMFTIGQAMRTHAAANSSIGGRNNLSSASNLLTTGALLPTPDMSPIADFNPDRVFTCANTAGVSGQVAFINRSWRDTVTSNSWSFTNANPATSTTANPTNVLFTQTGWADVSLTATSNAGSGSITKEHTLYAADPNAINAADYYQEFDGEDTAMYPIFNYFNQNNFKWELYNGRGFYDHKCVRFKNFDPRTVYANNTATQTPAGLYADFFTRGFNLSGAQFSTRAVLNFMTAGAYRATQADRMNDTLEVSYSTTCGASWTRVGVIAKGAIANAYVPTEFIPYDGPSSDWKLQGLTLPAGAKTSKTFFRFRYKPGVNRDQFSSSFNIGTGNNFYLDRINITGNALGINSAELAAHGVTVSPNPTNGAATVMIKGGDRSAASVVVTDIAGKVVYRTEVKLNDQATAVEIPAARIAVKGMYLVQVVANGNATTQKLVVY